jgi:WhiB family transcriptional regulator, redox-sensing transcriptional regulator
VTLFGTQRSIRSSEYHRVLGRDVDADDWRHGSACADIDTELFFPVGKTGPAVLQIEAAKAVCTGCEARVACLYFAVTTNQEYGVWGGTSEEERLQIRRAWRARQNDYRDEPTRPFPSSGGVLPWSV